MEEIFRRRIGTHRVVVKEITSGTTRCFTFSVKDTPDENKELEEITNNIFEKGVKGSWRL